MKIVAPRLTRKAWLSIAQGIAAHVILSLWTVQNAYLSEKQAELGKLEVDLSTVNTLGISLNMFNSMYILANDEQKKQRE